MLQNIYHFYSIAPMMGKTDSYFCFLMSLINNNITIYTEMMHSEAIIRTNILNEYKILGIIIILSAVIFSQLAPIYGKKNYGRN